MSEIVRVLERAWPTRPPTAMFADLPQRFWDDRPHLWDASGGRLVNSSLTWVIRDRGRTILVDTGIGNDKDRPDTPAFDGLQTDFLVALAAAGVRPDDVNLVVNTHLHADHVGWNTRLVDERWVPTFPNAHYLIPALDYEHFHDDPAIADSVRPVVEAGQAVLWRDEHVLAGGIVIEAAPGHTPGSSVLKLRDEAVFVGDLLQSPAQILEPDADSTVCLDGARARRSRRRILDWAADRCARVLPTHFDGGVVARDGAKFAC
ncbi:MBL fold metallo-hydrolase [Kutzneria buriramensis]|uniref:Glyoxylase-like metal-dependent hydrolase (Beta-lactamase superfamily II) n=1 Tax=Kutzneria buriramensis TaxID=1045776 RepID=A0A3E0I5I0_9PSEU|nr:MBL fold metallo-hydrolase [Kutzneria buriramensis]REH53851.1 glyoxylase-like metal-dependent hydrolase (beta-lactamase superfamily II) [Kutzneria buriramensis]